MPCNLSSCRIVSSLLSLWNIYIAIWQVSIRLQNVLVWEKEMYVCTYVFVCMRWGRGKWRWRRRGGGNVSLANCLSTKPNQRKSIERVGGEKCLTYIFCCPVHSRYMYNTLRSEGNWFWTSICIYIHAFYIIACIDICKQTKLLDISVWVTIVKEISISLDAEWCGCGW